jgi:hypothetical protein
MLAYADWAQVVPLLTAKKYIFRASWTALVGEGE